VVWPNPFSTDATVLVDAATSGTLLVLMRNALGQTQGSTSFAVEQGRFTFQLGDLAPVAQGVYFIELSLGEYRSVIRLVRQ
jgi:streptogramin lyase